MLSAARCAGRELVAAQAGARAWRPASSPATGAWLSAAAQPQPERSTDDEAADARRPAPSTPPNLVAGRAEPPKLDFNDPRAAFQGKSTADILRSLLVFKACQFRPLVKHADSLLKWGKRLVGSTVVNAVVKPTFYHQFVAGADAQDIQPTLRSLQQHGIRPILDYAAEDDVSEEDEQLPASRVPPLDTVVARTYSYAGEEQADHRMRTFLKSIEAAHTVDGQGFAAIKVTALGLPALLERVSAAHLAIRQLFCQFDATGDGVVDAEEFRRVYKQLFVDVSERRLDQVFKHLDVDRSGKVDYVSWTKQISVRDTRAIAARCRTRGPFTDAALSDEECRLLENMLGRVDRLAKAAADVGVRLMIDAEHSYFQLAIDSTVTEMQRRYNRKAPVVFNTMQCYMKDSYDRLLIDLDRARREGYKYGAKLVRGAYMVLERQRAEELGYPSPVQDTKEATHANYERCVDEMLVRVASQEAEVMVATHNQASIEHAVEGMARLGLPPSSGVYFGQLLGMADHLTYTLGQHGYGAYKYVPFGAIDEVMPYLIRRAQENSDMLGGVGPEVGMLRTELRRRLLGR